MIKNGIVGLVLLCHVCFVRGQDAAQSGLRDQDSGQSSVDAGTKTVEPVKTPEPVQTVEPAKTSEPAEIKTPPPEMPELKTPPPEIPELKTPAPDVPELSELDQAFKQSSLGKAADDFHTRIEWRKLQNDAANDPDVVEAKKAAGRAKTDLEKRERLKEYYDIYYAKMSARASGPEMRKALAQFKLEHLRRLSQPKVRPNSDLPMETPTATPTRGKKHKK